MKIPVEIFPLTPLSDSLDMNLGEKYITTKIKLVVFIDKLRSTFQGPDSCPKGLFIYDFRSIKMPRIIVYVGIIVDQRIGLPCVTLQSRAKIMRLFTFC